MLIYILFFTCIMALAINYELSQEKSVRVLPLVAVGLALLAGLRDPSIEKDYKQYLFIFDMIYYDRNPLYLAIYEPGFFLIVYSVRWLVEVNYAMVIMLLYAALSVFIKSHAIKSLAINPYLVLLFYFSHFYFLHEMTQIRVGLATAIFFFSLQYYFAGQKKIYFVWIILATLFHYSAILYLLLLFLKKENFNRLAYAILLFVAMALAFVKLPLIGYLGGLESSEVTTKIENHTVASEFGASINVFNIVTILNMLTCFYLLIAVTPAGFSQDKKLVLFLKSNIISIFFLSFLSTVPTIAFRVSDLFGTLSMFTFAYLARYLPFGKYNIFAVIVLAGIFFYFFALSGELVQPYKSKISNLW